MRVLRLGMHADQPQLQPARRRSDRKFQRRLGKPDQFGRVVGIQVIAEGAVKARRVRCPCGRGRALRVVARRSGGQGS
jgi:hypothetical protein